MGTKCYTRWVRDTYRISNIHWLILGWGHLCSVGVLVRTLDLEVGGSECDTSSYIESFSEHVIVNKNELKYS